jgi:hypothetical protein
MIISLLDKYMLRSDRWLSWLLFVVPRPPARPGRWRPAARSRLVTGRSRRGGPYAVTARHAQSRRCGFGHCRHDGPGPLALATLESLVHERLACATAVRSLCAARAATSARAALRCSAFGRVAAHVISPRTSEVASSIQKIPQAPNARCRAVVATPPAAPGSFVPWRQPGDWAVNHPVASIHRAPPPRSRRVSCTAVASRARCAHRDLP